VWDLASKGRIYDLFALRGGVEHLCFSPDGRFLAAAGRDGQLVIWDMQTGEQLAGIPGERQIEALCWGDIDSSGRRPSYALFAATAGTVRRLLLAHDMRKMGYAATSAELPTPSGGFSRSYTCGAVEGGSLLLGTTAGEVVVFSTATGLFRAVFPVCGGGVHALCRAAGGGVLVGGGDGSVRRFAGDDVDWVCESEAEGGAGGPVVALDASAGGGWSLAGTSNGRLVRLGPETAERTMRVDVMEESQVGSVVSCAFGADTSDVVCTGSADGTVVVWDLNDYSALTRCAPHRVAAGGAGIPGRSGTGADVPCAHGVALSRGEVLSAWSDGVVRGFARPSGAETWRVVAHRGAALCLRALPSFFLTGGADGRVCVWASDTRELLAQFGDHTREVLAVDVDAERAELAFSLGADRSVLRYDLSREALVSAHRLPRSTAARMTALTQRRTGERELVTGGADGRVLCWDSDVADRPVQGTSTAEPLPAALSGGAPSGGSPVAVTCAAVSPSGEFLALALADGAVRVLDAESLRVVTESRGHSKAALCLAWSPDERQVVSGGADCCVAVHNFFLGPPAAAAPAKEEPGRPVAEAPREARGRPDASVGGPSGRGSDAGSGRGRSSGQASGRESDAGSGRTGGSRPPVPALDTRRAAMAASGGGSPAAGASVRSAGGGGHVRLPSVGGRSSGRSAAGSHASGKTSERHTPLW